MRHPGKFKVHPSDTALSNSKELSTHIFLSDIINVSKNLWKIDSKSNSCNILPLGFCKAYDDGMFLLEA